MCPAQSMAVIVMVVVATVREAGHKTLPYEMPEVISVASAKPFEPQTRYSGQTGTSQLPLGPQKVDARRR